MASYVLAAHGCLRFKFRAMSMRVCCCRAINLHSFEDLGVLLEESQIVCMSIWGFVAFNFQQWERMGMRYIHGDMCFIVMGFHFVFLENLGLGFFKFYARQRDSAAPHAYMDNRRAYIYIYI